MPHLGHPQVALKLRNHFARRLLVFIRGDGRQEIPRVREPVRSQGSEFRKAEHRTIVLADVASGGSIGKLDPEAYAAGNARDLTRNDIDHTQLRDKPYAALLWHDEHLAVGVI